MNCIQEKDDIVLTFTGDIAFSGYFKDKYKQKFISEDILKYMIKSDYVIANIECPITNKSIESTRKINHYMSEEVVDSISMMNINIGNLANNHILDCGEDGLKDTINNLTKKRIKTIGAGINKKEASKTIIVGENIKIGLISLIENWNFLKAENNKAGCISLDDYETIRTQLDKLKKKTDYIVAIIHCGDEFSDMPMPYDRNRYIKILELGVDIIVGHHPHVVQNYEKIGNKLIFYSLGNFIFDTDFQRVQYHTDCGVILKIKFSKNTYSFDYISTKINQENNIVEIGDNPKIFIDINDKMYKKLWPIAACQYKKNNKIAYKFLNVGNKESVLIKLKKKLTIIRSKKWRIVEFGNVISKFTLQQNNIVYKYIKEKYNTKK